MKYLFLVPELKRGGPNNVVKNMIESSEFNDIEIFIICIRETNDFKFEAEFKKISNLTLFNLSSKNFFLKVRELKKIVNNIKPNVIHSHGFYPDLFSSFLSCKFNKISTVHNIIYQDYYSRYGVKGFFYSFFHYFLLKFFCFNMVFGCSEYVAFSLRTIIKSKKINYVNNGVNINKYSPASDFDKIYIKKKLGISSEIVITFCGGVERVKRVPELVDLYISKLNGFDFKFIIIGDGPELSKISDDNYIIKIGRIDDPSDYLKISDVVVSNSFSEGLPMAILEALASGCKVFLSDIPSHNFIIKNYPSCAFPIENLRKEIIVTTLKNKLTNSELYNISSEKMALSYLHKI